ncbi:MAG: tripartite tricarboxylate transporter substrate binding protein, partial [Noviherbaspirillum sp.]|nr:tripartite tricarboxylate transporter substrate binding protein [Noviherbaspirillum sp.]
KLSATIAEVLKQPDVVTRLNQLSLEGIGSTPAETAVFLKRESERWGKVVRQTNTTVE